MTALDCAHPNQTIEDRLAAIYALHNKKMDFRLDKGPYIDLLAALGNPHLSLPPVIHVAGTNGKGSVIAFLKSLLEADGKAVHTYTSPHLIKFNERIVLRGAAISDTDLLHYLEITETANAQNAVSFFEYTTALAFKAMAETPADFCLLETGLGGRLDCTNVVPAPAATIITSIGYDHMDWLGDTIEKIAAEKAGIMKPATPCIIAPQRNKAVYPVFEARAKDIGCPLYCIETPNDMPPLGLIGDHQKDNAAAAMKALDVLGLLNAETMNKGLRSTQWPARMEQLSQTPDIWFDCGHNADGAEAIGAQLKQWRQEFPDRPLHLVLALAADKDADAYLAPLWKSVESVTCVDLPNARNPQSGQALCEKITAQKPVSFAASVAEAIHHIPTNTNPVPRIMVTGSLYLYEQAVNAVKS